MDSIDITDSTFSLDVPDLNQVIDTNNISIGGGMSSDYTMYIYIGAAILLVITGMFIFKFYQNEKRNQSEYEQDCPGGFCTINQSQNQSQI